MDFYRSICTYSSAVSVSVNDCMVGPQVVMQAVEVMERLLSSCRLSNQRNYDIITVKWLTATTLATREKLR